MDYQLRSPQVHAVGQSQGAACASEPPGRDRHVPAAMAHLSHRMSDLESTVELLCARLENAGVLLNAPPTNPIAGVGKAEQKPPLAIAIDDVTARVQIAKSRLMDLVDRLEA